MERQASLPLRAKQIHQDMAFSPFKNGRENAAPASVGSYEKGVSTFVDLKKVRPRRNYERISYHHGRSMTEKASSKKAVWGGSLPGDIYGARTLKGTAVYQGLDFQTGGVANYGLETRGLMDDACVDRTIAASKVLRTHGLPTEKPVSVKELKEVLVPGRHGHFSRVEISAWEEAARKASLITQKKLNKYLGETSFIALERDVQVDERFRDVESLDNETELDMFLKPIFKWLNVATRYKNSGLISGTPKPPVFEINIESIEKYFFEFLPEQMGTYMGRLHKLGLVHGFPHSQNWSMVGTLYDLDSIYGKKIFDDDERPTDKNIVKDLSQAVVGLSPINYICQNFVYGDITTRNKAEGVLIGAYIKERYGRLNESTKAIFHDYIRKYSSEMSNNILRNILKNF